MANTSTNTVQAGQNWSTIAQNAGLTPQQFLNLNPQAGGSNNTYQGLNNMVSVGTQYYLPTSTSVVSNENAIGNANNIINKQGTYQSGPTTSVDANGNTTTTHADGSAYTPTTPPQPVVQGQGGYYNNVYYAPGSPMPTDANGNVVTLNDKPANYIDWNAMKAQFDATGVQQLANIEATYNNLIQQQQQANAGAESNVKNALLQGGITGQGSSSQYAPISSQGIITSQVNYGLQQIQTLNAQKQDAILKAQAAIQQGDFQYAQQAQAQADKIAAQQQAAMDKINNDLITAQKQMQKDNAIVEQVNNGIMDAATIFKNLQASGKNAITLKDVTDSLKSLSPTTDTVKLANGNTVLIDKATGKVLSNLGGGDYSPGGTGITNGSNLINGYDISSYATDPKHETATSSIYQTVADKDFSNANVISNLIKSKYPSSPITGQMIIDSANKYGVDPKVMYALMAQDSQMGTMGKAIKTYNPGNVGNDDTGKLVNMGSWQNGVDAVASWLSNHRSNSNVVQSITTDKGAEPVIGYALQPGDDPYFKAIDFGTDMETLKKLNPSITDEGWYNLQPGTIINIPDTNNSWLKGKSPAAIQAYNSLSADNRTSVQQLLNGEALMADIVKSRGIQGTAKIQQLNTAAKAIDPTYNPNEQKQRYQYQIQFNNPNGKEQNQINSMNTAMGHLAEFRKAIEDIHNTNNVPYNQMSNWISKNTGNKAVTNLNTIITALAGELSTVYKNGNSGTDQEMDMWRQNINSNLSTEQGQGVADITVNLLNGKLEALSNTYKNVMGKYPDNSIISQNTLQYLKDAGVDTTSIEQKLKNQGYNVSTNTSNDPIQIIKNYGNSHPEQQSTILQMKNDGVSVVDIVNWINQQK